MSQCLSRARRTCHHVTGEGNQGSPAAAALMARTRKVTFLVPASATPGFLSQIAALQLALRRLPWTRWQADIVVCVGGRPGLEATFQLSRWLPYLEDVTMVFARERATDRDHEGQIDELYRAAPADADVLVRTDADALPVANLEPLLDFVLERSAIAGITAHYRFPAPAGVGNREAWDAVAQDFLDEPLRFEHSYSLVTPDVSQEEQACPFYLNDGFVLFAREYFDRFAPLYLDTRPQVVDRLVDPYYAGQVALALSAARIPLPSVALPLRFQFPNDPVAAEQYPEELENAVVFHYLRTDQFDRQHIFRWRETYSVFLDQTLNRANAGFRDSVRTLFGDAYPFDHQPEPDEPPDPHDAPLSVRRGGQTAASASLTTERELLGRFREHGALEPLMKAKQSLVARFGVEDGWRRYKDLLGLPPTARIRYATPTGQGEHGRRHGTHFVETFVGGAPFRVEALPVLDGVTSPTVISRARSTHLARLEDVFVREYSAAIVTDHHALLDFEDAELDMFDLEFDIDPSFFSASRHSAWVLTAEDDPACLQIDEAFTLLGPHLNDFGAVMMTYLPRYLWADMSGELPHVPVLSSSRPPQTIRDAIRLVVPADVEIIELDPLQPVHLRRLWCSSNLRYAPAYEVMDERYSPLHQFPSPELMVPVVSELNRRVAQHVVRDRGPENVFLARKPWRWAQLVNAPEIEAVADEHGFTVVYPEELTFIEQVNLLANAKCVIAPEGSALTLCYFAAPGTRLLVLDNASVEGVNVWRVFFPDCELSAMAGTIVDRDDSRVHRSSYRIDPQRFRDFLREWL
jgi:Glycosyltransferase 61